MKAWANERKSLAGRCSSMSSFGESWCERDGYPQSSFINPILKRIKAVRVGNGKYTMPGEGEQ